MKPSDIDILVTTCQTDLKFENFEMMLEIGSKLKAMCLSALKCLF